MQKPNGVSTDRFDSGEKYVSSNNLPIEIYDDCSTQDATEFNDSSGSIDENTQHFYENSERIANKSWNKQKNLSINVSNCLKDFKETSILSPVSELAMNVALTKLVSADPVTGKFK